MTWPVSIEVIALISVWIVGHLCLLGATQDKHKRASLLAVLLCMAIVYSIKPATMDLFGYSFYFDTGYWPYAEYDGNREGFRVEDVYDGDEVGIPYLERFPNEIGFALTLKWLASALPHGQFLPRFLAMGREYTSDSLVFSVIAIGMLLFVVAAWNFLYDQLRSKDKKLFFLISAPIILGSIFFFVGSQNAIRQFLMLSLCILAMSYFGRQRYVIAVIISAVAISMHHWGWVFVGLSLVLMSTHKFIPTKTNEIAPLTLLSTDWLGLGIGTVMVVTITILGNIGFYEFGYALYLPDWQEKFRISPITKFFLLFFVMILSEIIAGTSPINPVMDVRQMRRTAFFLIAPLAILPELFSRTFFFFFAIETFYIIWALTRDTSRIRLSGALVFGAYAMAPNALNVLVGKGGWQEFIWAMKQNILGP